MKSFKRIFLLFAVVSALGLTGCRGVDKIKDIKVTSWSLKSVAPAGLRGVDAELEVGIENPAMQFTLEDIEGILYYKGEGLAGYTADPVTVRRRSTEVYPVSCSVRLSDGASLFSLLGLVRNFDPADLTTDVHANVRLKSGISKSLDFKNIPIKEFVD